MTLTPQLPDAAASNSKKAYHAPDVRDYGTVRELTHFGSVDGNSIDYDAQDYTTGDSYL